MRTRRFRLRRSLVAWFDPQAQRVRACASCFSDGRGMGGVHEERLLIKWDLELSFLKPGLLHEIYKGPFLHTYE